MIELTLIKKRNQAFTLIEIIIVMAVLSILVTMAVPRFTAFYEHANIANDKQLATIVANAGVAYVASHKTETGFDNSDVSMVNLFNSELISKEYSSSDLRSVTFTNISISYDGTFVRCILDGDPDFVITK